MEPVRVGMGTYKVVKSPIALSCVGLGSCVAVVLYDAQTGVGALGHVMLPSADGYGPRLQPGKFADTAIEKMIRGMARRGVPVARISARIFGGANMFPGLPKGLLLSVGEKNLRAVRTILDQWGIPIVAGEVGGCSGRTLVFATKDGSVRLRGIDGNERIYP